MCGIPVAKGFLGDFDTKAAAEVADGLSGRVAQVVKREALHDELDGVACVLGNFSDEGVPALVAPVALAVFVVGVTLALLFDLLGPTLWARERRKWRRSVVFGVV